MRSTRLVVASALVLGAPASAGDDEGEISAAAAPAPGWAATPVGEGIKPSVALDGTGAPAIVWLLEEVDGGFVDFASAADGWTPQRIVEGYFYGPIDVAFDAENRPNVVWHDHQDDEFDQAKGDLAYGVLDGGTWSIESAADDGHDGWDSTVVVAPDGAVWAAGIDPAQFGRSDGEPALSWFNNGDADLVYAERVDGDWQLETVAADGDVGRYSSLAFDSQGRPHLSFFEVTDGATGRVLHAVRESGAWTVEEVGVLEDVTRGSIGARRNSAIAVGTDDRVHVAFTDRSAVRLATRDADGNWTAEDVLTAGDRPLGQQVSLRLDGDGNPHLATYEVTGTSPLDGVILYLTRS